MQRYDQNSERHCLCFVPSGFKNLLLRGSYITRSGSYITKNSLNHQHERFNAPELGCRFISQCPATFNLVVFLLCWHLNLHVRCRQNEVYCILFVAIELEKSCMTYGQTSNVIRYRVCSCKGQNHPRCHRQYPAPCFMPHPLRVALCSRYFYFSV